MVKHRLVAIFVEPGSKCASVARPAPAIPGVGLGTCEPAHLVGRLCPQAASPRGVTPTIDDIPDNPAGDINNTSPANDIW
jgi:hypothetical protein